VSVEATAILNGPAITVDSFPGSPGSIGGVGGNIQVGSIDLPRLLPPIVASGGAISIGRIDLGGAGYAQGTVSAGNAAPAPGMIALSAQGGAIKPVAVVQTAAAPSPASVSFNLPKREGGF
jgi:hypothetical protein